ncbi:hypothetical protein PISMIDRAFT_89181 [Pisolithus microcarpus 441]|uniref:Transmembrane protein 188 n=1 Tax=Pisolithus microcarpus 441 TaxID=765257 RepID=A0A0D0AC15_9AGAM|nr:hypothetical protein PISMIDRAFT_89181 [Pisolithus microcarpus 441]
MGTRHASHQPRTSFHPPNDPATYRDLLLFEERLKTNAASLQRRKSRYQLFLFNLIFAIVFLLSEVLLQTALLDIPYTYVLRSAFPDVHGNDQVIRLHPYIPSGLLFVAVTALFLFFASGMYAEKIAYANRYVPHANKALRSFNMYLNVRKPPLRSKFSLNPFSFVYPRPHTSPESSKKPFSKTTIHDRSTSVPISPIPPASNPRGELIFSSRVERSFRESYERYRTAFERKRQERERSAAMQTWWGWLYFQMPWNRQTPTEVVMQVRKTSSNRGRGTGNAISTPSSSRRSSRSRKTPPSVQPSVHITCN